MNNIDELRHAIIYDPENGLVRRTKKTSHNCKMGWTRGNMLLSGYFALSLFRKQFLVHRLVWAIHYGCFPSGNIDHENQIRTDNRISNLRDVSCLDNNRNQRMLNTNTSGVTGVYWNSANRKYVSQISILNRVIYLGSFESIEDASIARKAAEEKYGFHQNHGRKR